MNERQLCFEQLYTPDANDLLEEKVNVCILICKRESLGLMFCRMLR